LTKEDILHADAGVRPLVRPAKSLLDASYVSREHAIIQTEDGVYHIPGVKLTDHRRSAAEVVDRLVKDLRPWNPTFPQTSSSYRIPLVE
jgi:glycerol-3-phosphate dehydrogenase